MNILHCITGLKVGGAESMLYNYLAFEVKQNSTDIHTVIYFHEGPFVERIKALGITTIQIKGLLCSYDPIFYFKLYALIKKCNPDIIHAALWSANIFTRLIGKQLNIPVICDLHSNVAHHGTLRNTIEKLTSNLPQQFIAVSGSVKTSFDKHITKTQTKKLCVIENGIDTELFIKNLESKEMIRKKLGFNQFDFIIGTVGRCVAIKNQALLIQAFALLIKNFDRECKDTLKLCIIGDGAERSTLERLTRTLNITANVYFLGIQPNVQSMYNLFDVFVLSSKTEGLSIALLEAITAGLPIITTAPTEGHDLLTNHKNGILLPYNATPQMLAKTLHQLYVNEELCLQLAKETQTLLPRIALSATVNAYKKIYAQLVVEKQP